MTADELQNWARLLRWVGLAVTAIGLALTFASHVVADRLLVVQRNDKIEAQERLKQTEAELRDAKTKAAKALETATELDKRQAPRTIPTAAGLEMVANLKKFSGQKYTAVIASTGGDVQPLWSSID
jgi:F0F1-type ATP synthase membrane subunit b/b'